mgnify:CR=1 FL=1
MFRWLLVAIASGGLMWGIQCGSVLLGTREGIPSIWHWLGLIASVVVTFAAMAVIGFIDYKHEKAKGNVVRTIRIFEQALARADLRRDDAASRKQE